MYPNTLAEEGKVFTYFELGVGGSEVCTHCLPEGICSIVSDLSQRKFHFPKRTELYPYCRNVLNQTHTVLTAIFIQISHQSLQLTVNRT